MADSKIPGNVFGVQIGSVFLPCQTTATLNMTVNVSEDDPCKVLDGSAGGGIPYVTRTADSRDWSIDVDSSLLRDSMAAANADTDLGQLFVDGTVAIDNVLFRTAINQEASDVDVIYSGPAILTSFSISAPATGANTTSATFSGNGALTRETVPVTT